TSTAPASGQTWRSARAPRSSARCTSGRARESGPMRWWWVTFPKGQPWSALRRARSTPSGRSAMPRSSRATHARARALPRRGASLVKLIQVDPGEQGRAVLGERLSGLARREVRERERRSGGDPVAGEDLGDVGGASAPLGDPAPQVVVLPAEEAAILAVAGDLGEGRAAHERECVDVVVLDEALGLPAEVAREADGARAVEVLEDSVGEVGVGGRVEGLHQALEAVG